MTKIDNVYIMKVIIDNVYKLRSNYKKNPDVQVRCIGSSNTSSYSLREATKPSSSLNGYAIY